MSVLPLVVNRSPPAVAGVYSINALPVVKLVWIGQGAWAETPRIVPQPGITSLDPVKVAFSPDPDSPDAVPVFNQNGRFDLFDISQTEPIKTVKTEAGCDSRRPFGRSGAVGTLGSGRHRAIQGPR